ncbi:MAG: site-specific integrase [Lachnospiraceae bacterium]|nr:site-specific integrase [Lachnospiraceae bacterium]
MEKRDNKGRILKTGESQRSDGRYMYRYKDERTGQRVTIYEMDLAELRNKEREIQRAIEEGLNTTAEAKKANLNTLFEQYMTIIQIEDSTRVSYNGLWERHVRNTIGRMKVIDIRPSHIKAFYADMTRNGYAWGTLKIIHGILCPLFTSAMEDDIILKNPAQGNLNGFGVKPKEREALSVAEQEKLLSFVKGSSWYYKHLPLITVMIGTACRVGEISGLTWDDLDLQDGEIKITHQLVYRNFGEGCRFYKETPKTDAGIRSIPMSRAVRQALNEQRKQQLILGIDRSYEVDGLKGFVFTSKSGAPLAPNAINNVLKNIVDSSNKLEEELAEAERRKPCLIPHISAHILRHTGCTRMAEAGMDPKVLQYIMGHADISVTMGIYNHVSGKERVLKEMAKLDAVI